MKCIAGWILLAVLVSATEGATTRTIGISGDICGKMNGRRYYLEVGIRAEVKAVNVTLPPHTPRLATFTSGKYSTPLHYLPASALARHRRSDQEKASHSILKKKKRRSFVSPSRLPLSTPSIRPPSFPLPASLMREELLEEKEEKEEEKEDNTGVGGDEVALNQPNRCGAEFFTCPGCHLEISFATVNLPSCSHDQSCRCDYVRVREPPYASSGGRDVCSTGGGGSDGVMDGVDGGNAALSFATQTRETMIDFLYARRYNHAFTIYITARRNKYHITGEANVTRGYIKSPYFPELYPKDHSMEYKLQAQNPDTRIKVIFMDFLLSPWSFVEIEDTNTTRLATFSGNLFRPPILVSSGNYLTIRFSGNSETARGFNLMYTFVSKDSIDAYPASSDCGGFVTNFGGTITMMNMAKGSGNLTLYDCVWIIQPPHNYAFKSHLSIKLVQFEDMVPGTVVEIRQGVTSEDYLLESVRAGEETLAPVSVAPGVAGSGRAGSGVAGSGVAGSGVAGSGRAKNGEHVAAVDTGFYVRLRGAFSKDSKLAIAYTSFSYLGSCYSITDLMCKNHRCIPKMLRCDGFDHCGDGSDEPTSCYGVVPGNKSLTPEDAAWWYQNTPNYYFPQKNSLLLGGEHGWSSVLLLVSLICLVMIIFGLISFMFKSTPQDQGRRSRERRGATGARASLSDGVEIFDAAADDPPLYEPPPDYEDVIKFILSGNNLKLVRRPGGVTAWVPDKLAGEEVNSSGGLRQSGRGDGERPLRTRHASLDLEHSMEVVLWNANGTPHPWSGGRPVPHMGVEPVSTVRVHPGYGHVRRSSLPVAPLPEILQGSSHGVSMAPETITEAQEIMDSPLPIPRPIQPAISSPQISVRSFNYDSSAVSTPGPSTPRVGTPAGNGARRLLKKGGRRKKRSSTARLKIQDDSAPPSYEVVMQQSSRSATPVHCQAEPTPMSQISESTQTSLDHDHDLTPTDRLRAARELFQRMSRDEREVEGSRTLPGKTTAPRRPSAPAVRGRQTRHVRTGSGGASINRGTVRARKAMLLRGQRAQPAATCACQGACSCATLNSEDERRSPTTPGCVQSRVNHYEASERESDDSTTAIRPDPGIKKRRLLRNKSAPNMSLVHLRNHQQAELGMEACEQIWPPQQFGSSSEELDQPLITPVSEKPPVVIPLQNKRITSIKNRVQLYDQMSRSGSRIGSDTSGHPSPMPSTSSSPQPGTSHGDIIGLEEGMRPGMVQEVRSRFMTALQQELPRLLPTDSDDYGDSPLPVLVPYYNLTNEEATTPDLVEQLPQLPPLKHDEAASIELWDAYSQGRSSPLRERNDNLSEPSSSASGAVPKKSTSTQITPRMQAPLEHEESSHSQDLGQLVVSRSRTGLTLELADKFSPAPARTDTPPSRADSLDDLHVINMTTSTAPSDDDTPMSSPKLQHLDVKLNESLDSETEQELEERVEAVRPPPIHHTASSNPTTQSLTQPPPPTQPETLTPSQPQPLKARTKIPVPSPRGSKMPQASTATIPVQRTNAPVPPSGPQGIPRPEASHSRKVQNAPMPRTSIHPRQPRAPSPQPLQSVPDSSLVESSESVPFLEPSNSPNVSTMPYADPQATSANPQTSNANQQPRNANHQDVAPNLNPQPVSSNPSINSIPQAPSNAPLMASNGVITIPVGKKFRGEFI